MPVLSSIFNIIKVILQKEIINNKTLLMPKVLDKKKKTKWGSIDPPYCKITEIVFFVIIFYKS